MNIFSTDIAKKVSYKFKISNKKLYSITFWKGPFYFSHIPGVDFLKIGTYAQRRIFTKRLGLMAQDERNFQEIDPWSLEKTISFSFWWQYAKTQNPIFANQVITLTKISNKKLYSITLIFLEGIILFFTHSWGQFLENWYVCPTFN